MGDWHSPDIREMMIEMIRNLTSQAWVDHIKSKIDDSRTYLEPEHYGAQESLTEDHGTCHHSFLSPDGDAVSVTASINLILGCKFMSPSTGVIMNNQMDDFASPNITSAYDVPPARHNFISPGKAGDHLIRIGEIRDYLLKLSGLFKSPEREVSRAQGELNVKKETHELDEHHSRDR